MSTNAYAQGALFTEVATDPGVGLDGYYRTPSARHAPFAQWLQDSLTTPQHISSIITTPMRHRGIPGVALLDYDRDGDLDMYVTNGPGAPNSLYQNQLTQTGNMTFVDVAQAAGVQATAQDSNGTCFGDIDNDGDEDLMVVGHDSPPILYENQGNGTFLDISVSAGINSGHSGMSCVMGDVNNDGQLDIFVARGYPLDTLLECFAAPASPTIQANDLFINTGNNIFSDASATSGIRDLQLPPGMNTITWSAAMVDYDLDGDLDIFTTDDQCNFPGPDLPQAGGFSWGTIRLFQNDGTGNFTNISQQAGFTLASEWMGTSWGDFDHDGNLDVFVTSFGEWGKQFVGAPIALGNESSRWYLGDGNGGFVDPGLGDLTYTPFGWGTSAEDFDNDGDTDIIFHGGLDMATLLEKSNPGGYLHNDGDANFDFDINNLGDHHRRRNDSGVAAGDLNGDGYVVIVSVSNFDVPNFFPLVPYSVGGIFYGTPWEPAFFVPIMDETSQGSGEFVWNGLMPTDGTISLDLNNAVSGNNSASITLIGTKGLTPNGANNRDGIGATLLFTPKHGKTAMKPILGGASHASQDALTQHFGLGTKKKGTLEVVWPGGVRNKLYGVRKGQDILYPEIPCSYDTSDPFPQYAQCVQSSLQDLRQQGVITFGQKIRFQVSAILAYILN